MKKTVNSATGPVTPEGKAISSKNATKDAIFVKGLLPWEDPQELAAIMAELQDQWGNHASARLLMLPIEQAYVEMRRLMMAQRKRIEGVMFNLDIAHQFVKEADLNIVLATQIPDWYFLEDDSGQKARALVVDRVQDEALHLKENFSDRVVPTIDKDYPELYRYVMNGYAKSLSFLTVLGHRYHQSTPALNLGLVSNEITEKYRYHLIWARSPERFEMIISSIRAQRMVEAMNLDQFSRYLTRCQNTITKGIQNLALLKQTLRVEREHQAKLSLEQTTIDLAQVNTVAANASSFTQKTATGTGDA
jgi:hypothetical protein